MNRYAVRKLTFSAGHRVYGHESKCSQLHGHGYTVFVTAKMPNDGVDAIGRVIDFSVLKDKIGGWINANFDHAMIVFSEDGDAIKALAGIQGHKTFLLSLNPTAENIALYILTVVCPLVLHGTGVEIVKVVVHETDNCSAVASLPRK